MCISPCTPGIVPCMDGVMVRKLYMQAFCVAECPPLQNEDNYARELIYVNRLRKLKIYIMNILNVHNFS